MIALGIDTSNYATSLAVVDAGAREVVCALKRILPVKEGELGLRQSDAVFLHTKALPDMLEELEGCYELRMVQCVGVSARPRDIEGAYMPCFLAGIPAARAFSLAAGVPLHTTSHQQGHVAAALFAAGNSALQQKDVIMFHLSGGTTDMLLVRGGRVAERLGGSMDLFAGQAVDRLGVQLGMAFPAGEAVSQLALQWQEAVTVKPSVSGLDCHLSGLQNQYEKMLKDGKPAAYVAKYVLLSIAENVRQMLAAARSHHPGLPAVCAGGVMGSAVIKDYLTARCNDIYFVPPQFSSDNAIGVALVAAREAEKHG